jgi:hypothetical protein
MKNFPHSWITMKTEKSSTRHRWRLLKKCPVGLVCHQSTPPRAMRIPDPTTTSRAATADTEDVDPRRHVRRLGLGQETLREEPAQEPSPDAPRARRGSLRPFVRTRCGRRIGKEDPVMAQQPPSIWTGGEAANHPANS